MKSPSDTVLCYFEMFHLVLSPSSLQLGIITITVVIVNNMKHQYNNENTVNIRLCIYLFDKRYFVTLFGINPNQNVNSFIKSLLKLEGKWCYKNSDPNYSFRLN